MEEDQTQIPTEYIDVYPKTILNKVTSPDIPGEYSMNPYQGCEHGCIYCYARNTHNYWGYSAGLDFEQKILVKKNAPDLLDQKLRSPNWKATPIMLSGNTDCYQPIERKLKITRRILEVLWKHRHPVGIITKNSLVLRDLDILEKMAQKNLVRVAVSITTLDEKIRNMMEPRTASVKSRLDTVKTLADHKIPVSVMMAPIIPGLNDYEIFKMVQTAAETGANGIGYTIVRLNGDIAEIFTDWLLKNYPEKASKIINRISECHGGQLNDSRYGTRMKGEGKIAEMINQQFQVARQKFFGDKTKNKFTYNTDLYEQLKNPQLSLF